jgi:hypothetical protein
MARCFTAETRRAEPSGYVPRALGIEPVPSATLRFREGSKLHEHGTIWPISGS